MIKVAWFVGFLGFCWACDDGGSSSGRIVSCEYGSLAGADGVCVAWSEQASETLRAASVDLAGQVEVAADGARAVAWSPSGSEFVVVGYAGHRGLSSAYIAKVSVDAAGAATVVWSEPVRLGLRGEAVFHAVTYVGANAVCAAGLSYGAVDASVSLGAGGADGVVACFADSDGSLLSAVQVGSSGFDALYDLVVDGSDANLYAVGTTSGVVRTSSAGKDDGFLVKIPVTASGMLGTVEVLGQYGTANDDRLSSLALASPASSPSLVLGGRTRVVPGGTQEEHDDIYLLSVDLSGEVLGTISTGCSGNLHDWVSSLATLPSGHVVAAGMTYGKLGNVAVGVADGVVFTPDFAAGTLGAYVAQFGTNTADWVHDVVAISNTEVAVVGRTLGVMAGDVGMGGWDAYVAHISLVPDTALIRAEQTGTPADDVFFAAAWFSGKPLVVVGETLGNVFRRNRGGRDTFIQLFPGSD